jgi:L-alanine-DL-glutamate epimerase-like enolase superfamily enzyme
MKITRIAAWKVALPLAEAYTLSYGTVSTAENVFLRLETDGAAVGYGCAAPDPAVTGETAEAVLGVLDGPVRDVLSGADPLRSARCTRRLRRPLSGFPAALAAVDMALYDLLGQAAGMPLYQILGGFRTRMKTSVTIGIRSPEETLEKAREWMARGFTVLKIKGGIDVDADVAVLRRLREALGPAVRLRFDANRGYTLSEAERFFRRARGLRLECLEQPVSREELDVLEPPAGRGTMPLMADESLMGAADVYRLAASGNVAMVNIKLMKAGGIRPSLRVAAAARAAGLRVMVGCMDEAALGIAAGLHLALGTPDVTLLDLDGHLDLLEDPTAGAVLLRNGFLMPAPRPGLGCPRI